MCFANVVWCWFDCVGKQKSRHFDRLFLLLPNSYHKDAILFLQRKVRLLGIKLYVCSILLMTNQSSGHLFLNLKIYFWYYQLTNTEYIIYPKLIHSYHIIFTKWKIALIFFEMILRNHANAELNFNTLILRKYINSTRTKWSIIFLNCTFFFLDRMNERLFFEHWWE